MIQLQAAPGASFSRLSPDNPRPRSFEVEVPLALDESVTASVDMYSDRLRCDHPDTEDGEALGLALRTKAAEWDRGRVVVLAEEQGSEGEAVMPGFYQGEGDCVVLAYAPDELRAEVGYPADVQKVDALIRRGLPSSTVRPMVETELATPVDAPAIAELITDTFDQYPTPSGNPDYIAQAIREGTPFRLVRDEGEVVSCASADLIRDARTAELTDCATRPTARGNGYMQAILSDLMDDLRGMGYPTAFTLARARIPGVNLAFQRLSFEYRGRMTRSCRIGDGIEDMNVWSRWL